MKHSIFRHFRIRIRLCLLLTLAALTTHTKGATNDIIYVQIEPIITTNYLRKTSQNPGFVQLTAQLSVRDEKAVTKLLKHMPLVREYIIEFLSFTEENVIKDIKQRKQLRLSLSSGIKQLLTEQIGEPLIENLFITQFMWN